MSDIEIARKAKKKNISEIASKLKIDENDLHPFGHHTAKINFNKIKEKKENSKLILVTAITPTLLEKERQLHPLA